jgi:hypothetical protein
MIEASGLQIEALATEHVFLGDEGSGNVFEFYTAATPTPGRANFGGGGGVGALYLNDGTSMSGVFQGPFISGLKYTSSSIPSCTAALNGSRVSVTDSNTQTWGATYTGSSSSEAGLYCDGTNWTVFAK